MKELSFFDVGPASKTGRMLCGSAACLWRSAAGWFRSLSRMCRAPRPIAQAVPAFRGWCPWLQICNAYGVKCEVRAPPHRREIPVILR